MDWFDRFLEWAWQLPDRWAGVYADVTVADPWMFASGDDLRIGDHDTAPIVTVTGRFDGKLRVRVKP